MSMAFRRWAVGLVALLVITSCGGSEEPVSTGDSVAEQAVETEPRLEPEVEATIEETAALALERFGDLQTAGVAILVAYDSGYSFDQIVAGVRTGTLAADGTIEGVELGVGIASLRGRLPAGDLNPDDIEKVRAALATPEGNDRTDVEQVLRAILLGVPVVRIAEAIVLDELHGMVQRAWCEWFFEERHNDSEGFYHCLEEADEEYGPGIVEPYEPDFDPGMYATTTEPDAEVTETPADPEGDAEPAPEMTFPRTYRDPEGLHVLSDFVYDIPTTCPTSGPMELVLAADGTATFTYFNGVGIEATLTADGEPVINCVPRPGNTWKGTYDLELGTLEIVAPVPEGFDEWEVGGIFDANTAEVYGGYSLPPNPAKQQATVEVGADLELV